jgi:hypothetical protein
VWVKDPGTGQRRDLGHEEEDAFWAWATVEVLRTTWIRIENSASCRTTAWLSTDCPAPARFVSLLQIVPLQTDTERLLLVSPELADVLARSSTGSAVPTGGNQAATAWVRASQHDGAQPDRRGSGRAADRPRRAAYAAAGQLRIGPSLGAYRADRHQADRCDQRPRMLIIDPASGLVRLKSGQARR